MFSVCVCARNSFCRFMKLDRIIFEAKTINKMRMCIYFRQLVAYYMQFDTRGYPRFSLVDNLMNCCKRTPYITGHVLPRKYSCSLFDRF